MWQRPLLAPLTQLPISTGAALPCIDLIHVSIPKLESSFSQRRDFFLGCKLPIFLLLYCDNQAQQVASLVLFFGAC